jgi:uncharacterized protein YndB with AHSA1/START domain
MTALDHLRTATRAVASDVREGSPTKVVTITQTYPVGVPELWDALTDASRISRWLMPVTGDLRVGGRYQLEGNAGGVVEECVPHERIAVTWEYAGDVSWVVATLSGDGTSSTLQVDHTAHVDQQRWDEYGPGAVGIGWDSMFLGLSLYLESGEGLDAEQAAAWVTSAEGRQFMTDSASAWRAAQIASGEDEQAATAAAERCAKAYTGG